MLAVQGLYDGNNFIVTETFPSEKKYKIIITFIEEVDKTDYIKTFATQTTALDFWENEAEDIYQDYLKK